MERNPYRCIYSSSYDRGLEHLLKIWPEVREQVPKAELHIFYGWQLFDKFYANNPGSMAWRDKMTKLMEMDGVTDHGRVPQPQMVEEYQKSGLFAYPTHFGEINCISAIKAQAYGAVPVVIDYAALSETVQFGIKVKGDIYDPDVRDEYRKQLIWALNNHDWQEEQRGKMMPWALEKYSWDSVAKQWDAEFGREK